MVSGSDMHPFDGVGQLTQRGVRVAIGHRSAQLTPDTDLVVCSAAIPETNPELAAARARRLPVVKYAELLGLLMRDRMSVAIAGTHGKSTTTALTAYLFRAGGLDASFVVGATCAQLGGNGGYGRGEPLVVEACEYDRSFLQFRPQLAAVLNIEADHFDCYTDFSQLVGAFRDFACQVQPGGVLLCSAEDQWVRSAAREASATVQTFGWDDSADWQARAVGRERGCFAFEVWHHGQLVLRSRLSLPGRYNVLNALAAIGLACEAGADPAAVAEALPAFEGIGRRLSYRGQRAGVIVVDDYAHHPTEIRLTIEAIRSRYEPRRTWVVFQPHQYSRTRHLLEEFARSFSLADEVIVPDVYGARETAADAVGVGSADLVQRIAAHGQRVQHVPSLDAVAELLAGQVTEGDLVVTMGAGDVWKVADALVGRVPGTD